MLLHLFGQEKLVLTCTLHLLSITQCVPLAKAMNTIHISFGSKAEAAMQQLRVGLHHAHPSHVTCGDWVLK